MLIVGDLPCCLGIIFLRLRLRKITLGAAKVSPHAPLTKQRRWNLNCWSVPKRSTYRTHGTKNLLFLVFASPYSTHRRSVMESLSNRRFIPLPFWNKRQQKKCTESAQLQQNKSKFFLALPTVQQCVIMKLSKKLRCINAFKVFLRATKLSARTRAVSSAG